MPKPAVARIWQGRTRASVAEEYAAYLYDEGVRKIRGTKGNLGVQVLRRIEGEIASFVTISYWPSRDEIAAYAGADIERPRDLTKDPEYLLELPDKVEHFDVLVDEWNADRGARAMPRKRPKPRRRR
jgi:heme-degrading monooxygenase HmoA